MKELLREVNACQKAQSTRGTRAGQTVVKSVKVKRFNMSTYKIHCIPDYPDAIWKYRTTDSYSTQMVSLVRVITVFTAHRTVVE